MAINRITWAPSPDPDVINVGFYTLEKAADSRGAPGPFGPLAVVNDVRPSPQYVGGVFFYDDLAGALTDWYRIKTTDAFGASSDWSAPFQCGSLPLYPTVFTAEELIASIKRVGSIPTSQATFTNEEFLRMADEEMATLLVPLIMDANEGFFLARKDVPTTDFIRIPARAVGAKLASVAVVDPQDPTNEMPIPRIRPEQRDRTGFFVQGGFICPVLKDVPYDTIRLRFYVRPATLVQSYAVGYVAGVDYVANTVTLSQTPLAFTSGARYDIVKGVPPFDTLDFELVGTVTGTNTFSFQSLPKGIEVGDIVSLSGTANVVQLPVEWFPVLAQATALKCLVSMNDTEGAARVEKELQKKLGSALDLVTQRVDNNVEVIVPYGPWRRA